MYLVYLDESGNTGVNLADPSQPVFLLVAMLVAEEAWEGLERDLKEALDARFPGWAVTDDFEIHAVDLRSGRGPFSNMSVAERIEFRDQWMDIGARHGIVLIQRHIEKQRYAKWLAREFGSGVVINPHVVAFALVTRCADSYLADLEGRPRGILISDENHETAADVEKSIRVLRGEVGSLKLGQIIEKGFFIQSAKSLPLQLCDLYCLSLRKQAERQIGGAAKAIDDSGIERAERLIHRGNERFADVIGWLSRQQQKKGGPG